MKTAAPRTVRVCLPIPLHAIVSHLLLPEPLGYAEEEGLRLTFHVVDGPEAAVVGVAAGDFDVAIANTVFAFRLRERGLPVKAFYSTCRAVYRSFAVPVDSHISRIADLKGHTVGTDYPDLLDLAYPTLRDGGLVPEEDVIFVARSIPIPGMAPTAQEIDRVANGGLDAVWVLACAYEMLVVEGVELRRLPAPTLDRLTPSEFLFAREDMLARNPEVLSGLGRAVAKASLFCQADPEAAVKVVWQHFPQAGPAPGDHRRALLRDVAGLRARTERGLPQHGRVPRWGSITEEEMASWEDFLFVNGGVAARHPLRDYFDNTLVAGFNDFDHELNPSRAEAQAGDSTASAAAADPGGPGRGTLQGLKSEGTTTWTAR